MRSTHTHTRFFSDDSPGMEELQIAFQKISIDALARSARLDKNTANAMQARVDLLMLAWRFLLDEAT